MNLDNTLRQAFEERAARVEPSPDALSTIRGRIHRQNRLQKRITMGLASVSSAAVVTVTAVLVGTVSCAPPSTTPTPPPGGSVSTEPTSPTSPPPTASTPGTVPVYYLGGVRDLEMLYREFHPVSLTDTSVTSKISAGIAEMFRGRPFDPDYYGAWSAGPVVRSVRVDAGVATIDLDRVPGFQAGNARAAQQQLVWTATAVAADAGSPVDGVRLLVNGTRWDVPGSDVGVDGVMRRTALIDTVAPVWLISPQQGETVGRSVRVHIDGSVFEATAHLLVRNAAGTVVHDDFVMLSNGAPARGEAFVNLTLAPGRYTLEAFYYSLDDSSVQAMDDHEITVS